MRVPDESVFWVRLEFGRPASPAISQTRAMACLETALAMLSRGVIAVREINGILVHDVLACWFP